jgi:hypothetical protein
VSGGGGGDSPPEEEGLAGPAGVAVRQLPSSPAGPSRIAPHPLPARSLAAEERHGLAVALAARCDGEAAMAVRPALPWP